MLRKYIWIPALALFLLPAIAQAQFEQGNWDLQLSGNGTASHGGSFNTGSASANVQLGYFMSKEMEVGVRQGLIWADGGSAWGGSTAAYFDWNFDMDRWVPYVGANLGYAYGTSIHDYWAAGPEAGVKYFLNSTTFVNVAATYEWNLNDGPQAGAYQFLLGLGVKF